MTATKLNCLSMADDDATATTAASTPDETELINTQTSDNPELAWSIDPDANTELAATPTQRSWKIPLIVATLATTAALTTSVIAWWPQQHTAATTTRPPTPTAPPAPSPDQLFIDQLKAQGVPTENENNEKAVGHAFCTYLRSQPTLPPLDAQNGFIDSALPPNWTQFQRGQLQGASVTHYCPELIEPIRSQLNSITGANSK
jgi:uncharacterized protein DUF732